MNYDWLTWAVNHLKDAPAFAEVVAHYKSVHDSDSACDYASALAMALKPILHDMPRGSLSVALVDHDISDAEAAEHVAAVLPESHIARALGDGHLVETLTKLLPLIIQIVGMFKKS